MFRSALVSTGLSLCRRVPTEAVCGSMHLYHHSHESRGQMTAEQEASLSYIVKPSLGYIVKPCLNQRHQKTESTPEGKKSKSLCPE